jgi:hypothetical protein
LEDFFDNEDGYNGFHYFIIKKALPEHPESVQLNPLSFEILIKKGFETSGTQTLESLTIDPDCYTGPFEYHLESHQIVRQEEQKIVQKEYPQIQLSQIHIN